MQYFILAGIASFIFSPLTAESFRVVRAESVGMSTKRLEILTNQLDDYVDKNQLSGGVALVLRKGKAAYFRSFGYRDLEYKDPMEKDDIFRIASQTKAIISVAIMILQERGQLLIKDPVGHYISEFNNTFVAIKKDGGFNVVKSKRKITVRDLLTHTAGVGWGLGPGKKYWEKADIIGWYFADKNETIQQTVKRIAKLPMDAQPGERFVYGLSTDILGALIEVVSGISLNRFLDAEIFKPPRMKDTHFYLDDTKGGRLTAQYTPGKDKKIRLQDPGSARSRFITSPRNIFSGSGGLVSTIHDYLKFQQMMLNGGQLDGVRILAPSTVSLMLENHTRDLKLWLAGPGMGFGLGYGVVVDRGKAATPMSQGSGYWGGAYCTFSWIDPTQGVVGVLMTQVRPYSHINIRQDFQVLAYQAITDIK